LEELTSLNSDFLCKSKGQQIVAIGFRQDLGESFKGIKKEKYASKAYKTKCLVSVLKVGVPESVSHQQLCVVSPLSSDW